MKTIISICDFSGEWAKPFVDKGYLVILVDPKHPRGEDGSRWSFKKGMHCYSGTAADVCHDPDGWLCSFAVNEVFTAPEVKGLLLAPVCTHFTVSGAQYWPAKDADGRTAEGLKLVDECLFLVDAWEETLDFWALENPVGRLPKLRPELGKPKMYFNPHEYAGWADDPEQDRYTKKTCLWGVFNADLEKKDRPPIRVCSQGSWIQKLGGDSERTKELRSMTPQGFSRAFCEANS